MIALRAAADEDPDDPARVFLIRMARGQLPSVEEITDTLEDPERRELLKLRDEPGAVRLMEGSGVLTVRGKSYVPPRLRHTTIENAHNLDFVAHFGKVQTMHQLQYVWWPGMEQDVGQFVELCSPCDRENGHFGKEHVLPIPIMRPFELVVADVKPLAVGADVRYLIVLKETGFGHVEIYLSNTKVTAAWLKAFDAWRASYGPFSVLITDQDSITRSKEFKEWIDRNQVVFRSTSAYHKSNGAVEIEMKFINQMLRKAGGDQTDLLSMIPKIQTALNSRHRFRCAGLYFSSYGLMRGFAAPSVAERSLSKGRPYWSDEDETIPTEDLTQFVLDAAIARGDHMRQASARRGVPFAPDDLPKSPYPDRMPPGTEVWLASKSMPSAAGGTRATMPRALGPFVIKSWEPSGLSALIYLKEDPKIHFVRNVEHLRPTKAPSQDGQADCEISAILGERRDQRGKVSELLVQWKGYGPEAASWIPKRDVHADELYAEWTKTSREARAARTKEAQAVIDAADAAALDRAVPTKKKTGARKNNKRRARPNRSGE